MAGALELVGAQPQKNPRYKALYTSRSFTGLVTNRSPLRSAASAYEERYLGSRTDALIGGSNCEITPRLTLARRPGNPVYNSNTFSAIDAFYEFRESVPQGANSEQIRVMADTASVLYDATGSNQISVFSKSAGSGQTFMQSVGNTLYFADGIDQKKWVQSLFTRTSSANGSPNIGNSVSLSAAQFPFGTFLIDSNGNLQELLATQQTTVTNVQYVNATNTLTLTVGSITGITKGTNYVIWDAQTATWLNGATFEVTASPSGSTVVAELLDITHADYASTAETANLTLATGGTPVTGNSVPAWSTQTPSNLNNFQGGITIDGTAVWINRGNPIQNWGIVAGAAAPTVIVGATSSAWQSNTFYSLTGAIIDTQFGGQTNIWKVTVGGKSGNSNPFTSNPTSGSTTVTDNGVTWECVASTHSGDAAWAANTSYPSGHLIVASASGTQSLFQLQPNAYPNYVQVSSTYVTAKTYPHNNSFAGQCELRNPADNSNNPGSGSYPLGSTFTGSSILFNPPQFNGTTDPKIPMQFANLNAAGNITGYQNLGITASYNMIVTATINIPAAGKYSFQINHDDGMYWAMGLGSSSGAQPQLISGPTNCPAPYPTKTALNGYSFAGISTVGANNVSGYNTDTYVVNFPSADQYTIEIDYCQWQNEQALCLYINGQTPVPGTATTGSTQPSWPIFSTSFAPNYASVSESNNSAPGGGNGPGPLSWFNLGPITDAVWQASTSYTLPDTTIIDPNSNTEAPFRAGITGSKIPTFATGINQLTNDNPNLIWINQGTASIPAGALSTFNGGWQYCVGLGNSVVDAASNASPLSTSTGNFPSFTGVTITGGLPTTASIDPQSDSVYIFRTTDGETTPFLVPGTTNLLATIPLPTYLVNGYLDTATDEQLNNLIEAPIAGENTPPALGAQNLTYHLGRIWFSVGNTVFWTTGPDTPIGNGIDGVLPTNTDTFPSLVKRIVPTTVGAFIFTVSDIYLITGQGTPTSPIQPGIPYAPGLGLLSYNALDYFGGNVGFFASDSTFNVLDISSGTQEVGFNIGNLLQNTAVWNPATAYVTWHTAGEDKAWFLSNGSTGWYRISTTPSPEQGITISPFATITGGCQAVQSIETTPGKHQLLVGPTSSGPILARSLSTFTDNTTPYIWNAIIGSIVLTNPGSIAQVAFITTESVLTGSPLSLSVLLDDRYPQYTGPFESLDNWENDPPGMEPPVSTYAQRFYLSQSSEPAACRHLQIQYSFPEDEVQNEVETFSVFGSIEVEA